MKNNIQIIRQAAVDLYSVDHMNVIKVAGVVRTIVNWLKGFGDPEFQNQLQELERISPEIKGTVDALSVEIGRLQKAISNTDPEQFGLALEAVRPLVSELSGGLSNLDEAAARVKAEAPVDAVVNSNGEVISGENVKRLDRGWKKDTSLLESMKSLLPDSLDVPIQSHINKPLMDFTWFQQFGPEHIRFSKQSSQWVLDEIAKLVFDTGDLDSQSQNNIINFLNRNQDFIISSLKDKIINGTLRSYTFPSEGQPNRMSVLVDAGTMRIPGLNFEVQFPTIFLNDRFASIFPIKELDVAAIKNVRPQTPYEEPKIDLDENLILSVLDKNDWNIAGAAREIGITDKVLRRKMQELNITRPQPIQPVVQEELIQPEKEQEEDNKEEELNNDLIKQEEAQTIASRIELIKKLARSDYTGVASIKGLDNKSPQFIAELINVGNRLNIDPSFLASVMLSESGFDHTAVNPHGGATGLIQFMPSTSANLGTSTEELAAMTDVQQLAYVEKFFRPWAGRIKTPGDLYMATFLPIFVGKPRDYIIGQKDNHNQIAGNLTYHKVWEYNKGFDSDKDGKITVGDVSGRANGYYSAGMSRGMLTPDSVSQNNPIAQGKGSVMPEQSHSQPQSVEQEQFKEEDAHELFNFLFASGPIEKIVRRSICKKVLPDTRVLISIGSLDIPFHTRVRFAKILSSALRIELDAESSIHNYGDKIEIESNISGSQKNVLMATKGICEGISDAFELATEKGGSYKISSRIFSNVKSGYALIDSGTMETCFRKFAFDMVNK